MKVQPLGGKGVHSKILVMILYMGYNISSGGAQVHSVCSDRMCT